MLEFTFAWKTYPLPINAFQTISISNKFHIFCSIFRTSTHFGEGNLDPGGRDLHRSCFQSEAASFCLYFNGLFIPTSQGCNTRCNFRVSKIALFYHLSYVPSKFPSCGPCNYPIAIQTHRHSQKCKASKPNHTI